MIASAAWDAWCALAARLPADLDLDTLARETGAVKRKRSDGIVDGTTLLRLALARGPGGMNLQQTAAWAGQAGIADIVGQSLNERLHRATDFFAAITHHLLTKRPAARSQLWNGRCLRIADASSLSEPGSQGTDWRLHAVYDLGRGGFSHLSITDRKGAELLLRAEPAAGEVLLADRGYAKARELQACFDPGGKQAREVIVRVGWKAIGWRDPAGGAFDLIGWLGTLSPDSPTQDRAVLGSVGSASLALRLIVVPLPEDKAETNRQKLLRKAVKRGETADPRSLVAAGFLMLVTNLPDSIPATEIALVYRLRWQVELAFKRLKSLLQIDRLPTRTTGGSLSWLYPHLILVLISDEFCQDILESSP